MDKIEIQKITSCCIEYFSPEFGLHSNKITGYSKEFEFNTVEIPSMSICKVTYNYIDFGQSSDSLYKTSLIFYNNKEVVKISGFIGIINFLNANGFELISYHPELKFETSSRINHHAEHAILRKK